MRLISRTAFVALVSVIVLVFVGAIVRVTGSGLGCPDWPTCWGNLIPPTKVEQIDLEKIDIAKFKRYAERHSVDPDSVTKETVLASFNPVHTWIEFVNRLTSLPLGFATLLLALVSFRATRHKGWIVALSWLSLFNVLFNAWMGAMVVRSGLQPGIITLHMALALLLVCLLVSVHWLSQEKPKTVVVRPKLIPVTLIFFVCLFVEGVMGSQVRELTDVMKKAAGDLPRSEWIDILKHTPVYLFHRSFAWTLLISGAAMLWLSRLPDGGTRFPAGPKWIFGIVVAMMLMGIILAHIAIYPVVQVLHVGLTAVLLAITWNWVLDIMRRKSHELPN